MMGTSVPKRGQDLWLLKLAARVQLNEVDSTDTAADFPLPLARDNQNVEVIVLKISADANAITPTPSTAADGTTDTINIVTPLVTQWDFRRYISNGVSTWYDIS